MEVQLQPVRESDPSAAETISWKPPPPSPKRPPPVDRHDQEVMRLHNGGKPHSEHTLDERLKQTKHAVFRLPRDVGDIIKFPDNRGLEGTTEPGAVARPPELLCRPDAHEPNQDIEEITYPGASSHIQATLLEDHVDGGIYVKIKVLTAYATNAKCTLTYTVYLDGKREE